MTINDNEREVMTNPNGTFRLWLRHHEQYDKSNREPYVNVSKRPHGSVKHATKIMLGGYRNVRA